MSKRRALSTIAIVCLVLVALGGCDKGGASNDTVPGMLKESDLPALKYAKEVDGGVPAVSACSAIKETESTLVSGNEPPAVVGDYWLESGDHVSSIVAGRSLKFGSVQEALAGIEQGIEDCVAQVGPGDLKTTRLEGLETGAVGYRSTSTTSGKAAIGERLWVISGDRLVGVGASHDGSSDLQVDLEKLLDVAVERAKEAPSD